MAIKRLTSQALVWLAVGAAAQVSLEVDVGKREADMKRIIDFFPDYQNSTDFKNLRPRYVVPYKGTSSQADGIRSAGCIPVLSLHERWSETDARNLVNGGKAKGVQHYVVWTEPNRTWGDWLSTDTWETFLAHSEKLYKGARAADPNCYLSGPCITTDPRDTQRWQHLTDFLSHWAQRNMRLDYVNVHPPFEPDDLTQAASIARGFANTQSQMQIKGLTVGEYPFFLDDLAVHVRFFLVFETAWNVLWAAKSNYRANSANSGLLDESGRKLPVYWLFYQYARMEGKRLHCTKGGNGGHVQVLASYNATGRTLQMLVGNDGGSSQAVTIALKTVVGRATVKVYTFNSAGTSLTGTTTPTAANNQLSVSLGTIADKDARYVTVVFDQTQPETPLPPPPQDPYTGVPHAIPGTIQAEDYDKGGEGVAYHDSDASNSGGAYRPGEGVDIKATPDEGGGFAVGWVGAGEWIEYTVDVSQAGKYRARLRTGSAVDGGVCHLEFGGSDLTGSLNSPNTGSWDSYQTVVFDNLVLDKGRQIMRLVFDGNAMDVNYVAFEPATEVGATARAGKLVPTAMARRTAVGNDTRLIPIRDRSHGVRAYDVSGRLVWQRSRWSAEAEYLEFPAVTGSGVVFLKYFGN